MYSAFGRRSPSLTHISISIRILAPTIPLRTFPTVRYPSLHRHPSPPDYFSPSVLLFPANNLLSLPDRSSPPRENPRSIPLSWFLYHTPIVVAWQPPSLVRSPLRRAPSSSSSSSDQRLTVSRGTGSLSRHRVPPAFTTSRRDPCRAINTVELLSRASTSWPVHSSKYIRYFC